MVGFRRGMVPTLDPPSLVCGPALEKGWGHHFGVWVRAPRPSGVGVVEGRAKSGPVGMSLLIP